MSTKKVAQAMQKAVKKVALNSLKPAGNGKHIPNQATVRNGNKTPAVNEKRKSNAALNTVQSKNRLTKIDTDSILKRIKAEHGGKIRHQSIGKPSLQKSLNRGDEKEKSLLDESPRRTRSSRNPFSEIEGKSYLPVGNYRISSSFGVDRGDHVHSGIDLAVAEGTPVDAVKSGTVSYAGWSNGYGYRIVVDHEDGTQTTYNHLSDIGVVDGDKVMAGSQIGLSGNTGNSTGPHLHFEVIVNGEYVNPESYFDFGNGIVAGSDGSYTSKLASVSSKKASSSSSSSSASLSSPKLSLATLAVGKSPSYDGQGKIEKLNLPKSSSEYFSRRTKEAEDYFENAANPLILLVPSYNYGNKSGRTSRTQITKKA